MGVKRMGEQKKEEFRGEQKEEQSKECMMGFGGERQEEKREGHRGEHQGEHRELGHEELLESMSSKLGFTPHILEILGELDSESLKRYNRCDKKLLSDGALPAKTKILAALAVVASKQCERCCVVQMQSALNNGATKEEILELMDVIFITSGAPAVAACRDALKMLK
jgi:AhpD family alkylhydroperoxidase